jgi:hypothetical protein
MTKDMDEESSEVAIGGISPRFNNKRVRYHTLLPHDVYWAVPMDDIEVDGQAIGACKDHTGGKCKLVVDSGTSFLTGPYRKCCVDLLLLRFRYVFVSCPRS